MAGCLRQSRASKRCHPHGPARTTITPANGSGNDVDINSVVNDLLRVSTHEYVLAGPTVAVGLVDKKVAPVEFKELELPIPRYHPADLRGRDEMVVYEKVEKI